LKTHKSENPEAISLQNPFWVGMLSAWITGCICICACVCLLPRLTKAMKWMHKGLRTDDRLGFLSKLKRDSCNPEWRHDGNRSNGFSAKSKL